MKKVFILTGLILTFTLVIDAQPGWNWPEDKATAEEKNALYTDNMKGGRYDVAAQHLQWLLDNAPNLNPSIYINGANIYEELAKKATDPAKKLEYQEKSLAMYDQRIEHFNHEEEVLNRKAFQAYSFYKKNRKKYHELFDLYEETFEKSGNNVHTNNLVAYMDVLRRYKLSGGELTDVDILDRYDRVNEVIDAKIKAGESAQKLEKNREFVDKLLTTMVTVDCDFIADKLGSKLKADPDNLKLAKKIMGLSLAGGCTELPIFLNAAKKVQGQEPTFGMAKIIGIKSSAQDDFQEAIKYYNQAIELAENDQQKGEVYYEMAVQYAKRGLKPQSRANAFKAVGADPSIRKAYKLVGDLYMTSYNECKKGESKVEDRAVFLAAYEMYKKAGNQQMMQSAQEQFPSMQEIFELNMEEGQNISVGCWIKESVTIQRRPS